MTDLIVILILLLTIITICAATYGVLLMAVMGFNRARRKGYNPAEAALLTISLWGLGALGGAIFEIHRFRSGAESWFDAFILFWTVFLTVPLVNVWVVKGLPRRLGRTSGSRRLSFSLVRLGWWVAAVWIVLSLAIATVLWLAGTPYIGALSVGLAVAVCGLAGGIFSWGRAFRPIDRAMENLPSLNEYLIADPRPPVLYLRPFQMESYVFSKDRGFERFFHEALTKCGPFVALGNPHDYVPPLGGAVRLYASDTDWIQKLGELARQSSYIVVQRGRSDNLRGEYEYLRREGMQEKLFIFTEHPKNRRKGWLGILGEMVRFGTLRISWQEFSADLAKLGYDLGLSDPGRGAVITFDVEGRGIVLTTQAETAAEFVEPIRAWVERRDKIGRGIPTQCISCGQRHYVFPADTPVIRERWCPKCDLGLNALERTVKRFCTKHLVGTALVLCVPLVVVPIIVFGPLGILFMFLVEVPVLRLADVWTKHRIWRRLMRLYERLAEAGDAVAMANLGLLRTNPPIGLLRKNPPITASDYRSAALWFRKSAEAGDIGGMIHLADILARGSDGLDADANQAVYWYKRAAALGSRAAQQKLESLPALAGMAVDDRLTLHTAPVRGMGSQTRREQKPS
jgi:hypothetical protein